MAQCKNTVNFVVSLWCILYIHYTVIHCSCVSKQYDIFTHMLILIDHACPDDCKNLLLSSEVYRFLQIDQIPYLNFLVSPSVPTSVPQASFVVTPTVIGGRSSLSVQWRPPSSDLPVLEYTVIVKVSSLVGGKGRKETTNSTSLTVENLPIGTTYTINVRAKSAVGFGAKLRRMVNTLDGEELVCCVWHH